jgi:hypothetical protein
LLKLFGARRPPPARNSVTGAPGLAAQRRSSSPWFFIAMCSAMWGGYRQMIIESMPGQHSPEPDGCGITHSVHNKL